MSGYDERRQQIVAAAVIIQLRFDKATMDEIAEAAGASRGTVYSYFKGREELFEALLYRQSVQVLQP
ncbi:MAG TPA: helix-turn-helix domain-containing protein [Anaerolineales bacterium]|nr:helix-turn-helix domain-containing protein [Anaerolineales bacterium]